MPRYSLTPSVTSNGSYKTTNGSQVGWTFGVIDSQTDGTFSSQKTPGFRSLKRSQLPMLPFSHHVVRRTVKPSSWVSYSWPSLTELVSKRGHIESPGLVGYGDLPRPDINDLDRKARTKLLEKLKNSSFNLAQAVGERAQTVNMLTKTVNRVASAAMAVRRGKFGHAQRLLGVEVWPAKRTRQLERDVKPSRDNLANHWLELQYGWKPLLSDIHGAAEHIAKTFHEKRPVVVRTTQSLPFRMPETYHTAYVEDWSRSDLYVDGKGNARVSYVLEYREDDSVSAQLAQTGISNPALLAWELAPWSFVVDWVYPIGDYLSLLDATHGLSFVRGCVTSQYKVDYTARWRRKDFIPGWRGLYEKAGQPIDVLIYTKTRSILNGFPSPPLPTFEPSESVTRALTSLALLQQVFSSKREPDQSSRKPVTSRNWRKRDYTGWTGTEL